MRDQQPFTTSLCAMIKSRFGVEKVRDADAPILVPTEEGALGSMKSADRPNHDLCAMLWDATVFGVINENFPVYIKHEDLSEITHGGQCLNNSIIQLWILQVCEWGMSMCMDSSSHSPYRDLGNHNLNQKVILRIGCKNKKGIIHWKMIVILPKKNVVIRFYSLHNRLDNYLKGIINNKFKATARWIVVKYFNDGRPLEPKRLKVLRMEWATYYLKVKNETISV
ncbi:hypothetical protein GmHk_02G005376 [Glycine max]|nr:hypothetical protein GmHk_02G005376 [Glycine max]